MSFYGMGLDVPYIKKGTTVSKIGKAVADNSGSCGNAYALQEMLKDLGYYTGDIDGSIGNLTIKAWQTFAKDKGLSTNGAFFPQKVHCQAIMDAWEAAENVTVMPETVIVGTKPAAAPASGGGSSVNVSMAPKASSSKSGIAKFWDERSTTERAALVGGGLLVVGGAVFALTHSRSQQVATANRRRKF